MIYFWTEIHDIYGPIHCFSAILTLKCHKMTIFKLQAQKWNLSTPLLVNSSNKIRFNAEVLELYGITP